MKSKSKKKVFGGPRDIISGLPDAMICHILSFLPTKEAASTSVLAKRWKHLLAFVPNLHFDEPSLHPDDLLDFEKERENSESFIRFVDSVLALQAKANARLERFQVSFKYSVDPYHVLDWIPKVLKRGVLYIDLKRCCYGIPNSRFNPLPSEIFVSKTLVRLKIEFIDGVNVNVKGVVSLPKLKTLHLDDLKIEPSMFNKLLSGCHVLEELVLVDLVWDLPLKPEPCSVTVSIPTLKRLKFCRSELYGDEDWEEGDDLYVSLSFDNPNLVYLEYSDYVEFEDKFQQVSLDSLVEASLGLQGAANLNETEKISVTHLLMGVCNVKILYLTDDIIEVLSCCPEIIPVFDKLVQITINQYVHWGNLSALLKNCPNLETLVFEGLQFTFTNRCEDLEKEFVMDVRTCLSSSVVKVIKILKFGEYRHVDYYKFPDGQIEQVKEFLETMPDLEQMIVYYNTPKDEDVVKVFKQLQKLPRASAKCNIQLISDNLNLSTTMTKYENGGRRSQRKRKPNPKYLD